MIKNKSNNKFYNLENNHRRYFVAFKRECDAYQVKDMVNEELAPVLQKYISYQPSNLHCNEDCNYDFEYDIMIPKRKIWMPTNSNLDIEYSDVEHLQKSYRLDRFGFLLACERIIDDDYHYVFGSEMLVPQLLSYT